MTSTSSIWHIHIRV